MSEPFTEAETPVAAARRARVAQDALKASAETPRSIPSAIPDPLHFCVYTTVSLFCWTLSPGLVTAFLAFVGLHAYARAWRAGLRRSECVLRDPRLVMLYLGLVGVSGLGWTAWRLAAWIHAGR